MEETEDLSNYLRDKIGREYYGYQMPTAGNMLLYRAIDSVGKIHYYLTKAITNLSKPKWYIENEEKTKEDILKDILISGDIIVLDNNRLGLYISNNKCVSITFLKDDNSCAYTHNSNLFPYINKIIKILRPKDAYSMCYLLNNGIYNEKYFDIVYDNGITITKSEAIKKLSEIYKTKVDIKDE